MRTWLPLLGCSVAAAAGAYMRQRRLEWAALGGVLSFFITVWQERGTCTWSGLVGVWSQATGKELRQTTSS